MNTSADHLKAAKEHLAAAAKANDDGDEAAYGVAMGKHDKAMKLYKATKDLEQEAASGDEDEETGDSTPAGDSEPGIDASAKKATKGRAAAGAKTFRPPFPSNAAGEGGDGPTPSAIKSWAIKTAYVKQFGEPDAAMNQISKELYGSPERYFQLRVDKARDLKRYLKTGNYDPALKNEIVLTPEQIAQAYLESNDGRASVAAIKSTMIESQDTLGGYAVPEDFQQGEIISRLPSIAVVRPRATVRQTTRDVYSALVRTGGNSQYIGNVRVTPVDESPTSTQADTNSTFGKSSIPINTLMATVSLSRDVLEDSGVDLSQELYEEFATARAIAEDNYYLTGNGVAVPLGILKDPTTGGPSNPNTTTVAGGGATTLTGDSIKNIPLNLDWQYRQLKPVWVSSKGTKRVIKTLKDGSGAYLWADRQFQLRDGDLDKLEGYDWVESEILAAPTATNGVAFTANVYPMIFGDMKGYRIVDRIGMSVERYLDSTTARTNSVTFLMRWRGGGAVVNGERFVVLKVATS